MTEEFVDFEFRIEPKPRHRLPAYLLERNPYRGRAFRSAIEAAYGTVPAGMSLRDAFAAVRDEIVEAAASKVIALEGDCDMPVAVTGPDICNPASMVCRTD